jgi:hypothetical protein
MKPSRARKRFGILLVGLALVGGVMIFRSEPSHIPMVPAVQFLAADSRIPPQPITLFERWVPMSWSWLWKLRDRVRGPLPGIVIDGKITESRLSEEALLELLPEPALAETNGLRGWILHDTALSILQRQIERTGGGHLTIRPRIQTSHGIQSSMSVGSPHPLVTGSQVGLTLEVLPRIQRDGTELMTVVKFTGAVTNQLGGQGGAGEISIVTNLAAAAQWALPDGMGILIVGPIASKDSPRISMIISATAKRPK